jgi:hypothetical protein
MTRPYRKKVGPYLTVSRNIVDIRVMYFRLTDSRHVPELSATFLCFRGEKYARSC